MGNGWVEVTLSGRTASAGAGWVLVGDGMGVSMSVGRIWVGMGLGRRAADKWQPRVVAVRQTSSSMAWTLRSCEMSSMGISWSTHLVVT